MTAWAVTSRPIAAVNRPLDRRASDRTVTKPVAVASVDGQAVLADPDLRAEMVLEVDRGRRRPDRPRRGPPLLGARGTIDASCVVQHEPADRQIQEFGMNPLLFLQRGMLGPLAGTDPAGAPF